MVHRIAAVVFNDDDGDDDDDNDDDDDALLLLAIVFFKQIPVFPKMYQQRINPEEKLSLRGLPNVHIANLLYARTPLSPRASP